MTRLRVVEPITEVVRTEDLFADHVRTVPGECLGHTFDDVLTGQTPQSPTIIRYRRKAKTAWGVTAAAAAGAFLLGVVWSPLVLSVTGR